MLIYKILRHDEWGTFQKSGVFQGAPIDLDDGFIHFSTAAQAKETAKKHFADVEGLTIAAFKVDKFGDRLKWEVSRNNDLFPHLYDALKIDDMEWARLLPIIDGVHKFPDTMS